MLINHYGKLTKRIIQLYIIDRANNLLYKMGNLFSLLLPVSTEGCHSQLFLYPHLPRPTTNFWDFWNHTYGVNTDGVGCGVKRVVRP